MNILRRFTDSILRSRLIAMTVAFIFAYVPFLGSVSLLIAALVTLRKGVVEGVLVLLAATVPLLLSYYASSVPADQASMALVAVGTMIITNVLVWLYAVLLRRYSNWSLILELSVLLSVVLIGIVHFFNPDIQHWWSTQLTAFFARAADALNGPSTADVTIQSQVVEVIKYYATGLVAVSILCNALMQLALARWWEAALFVPGLLRRELHHLRFGYVMGVLFIVVLLSSFWDNTMALDVKPVFYGLFGIAGLSLVHCLLARVKYSWFWLILVYAALIVLSVKGVIALAVFALLDVLFNLRQRLTRI